MNISEHDQRERQVLWFQYERTLFKVREDAENDYKLSLKGLHLDYTAILLNEEANLLDEFGWTTCDKRGLQEVLGSVGNTQQDPIKINCLPAPGAAAGFSATAGLSSVLMRMEVLTTQQQALAAQQEEVKTLVHQEVQEVKTLVHQQVLPRLQTLENGSSSSLTSMTSRSSKNHIDRKQKACKEAARRLYGVEPCFCQVTGRKWQEPEVVSCSHLVSRGWLKKYQIDLERAGLKDEWDPRNTLFFIKRFEEEFDRGNICLVWSGLDGKQLDSYKVKVLDRSLLGKSLSKTQGGDEFTFEKVDNKGICFPTDERPSRRAINLHASWAHKQAASKPAAASSTVTLNNINKVPESVWSGNSWKGYVEEWLANNDV